MERVVIEESWDVTMTRARKGGRDLADSASLGYLHIAATTLQKYNLREYLNLLNGVSRKAQEVHITLLPLRLVIDKIVREAFGSV